jgi:hypothetical protein
MSTSDAVIERVRVREAADVLADVDAVRQKLRAPYIAAGDHP